MSWQHSIENSKISHWKKTAIDFSIKFYDVINETYVYHKTEEQSVSAFTEDGPSVSVSLIFRWNLSTALINDIQ